MIGSDNATKSHGCKERYDLIPPRALREVALVFTRGVKNGREPWDWVDVDDWFSIYTAAMMRHGELARIGETATIEHIAAVAANALILLGRICGDSRPDKHSIRDSQDASNGTEIVAIGYTSDKTKKVESLSDRSDSDVSPADVGDIDAVCHHERYDKFERLCSCDEPTMFERQCWKQLGDCF